MSEYRAPIKSDISQAHRKTAAQIGIDLAYVGRNTFASRTIAFAVDNPSPNFDHLILVDCTVIRDRPSYSPFIRFISSGLFFDFSVRGKTPNWRVRQPDEQMNTRTVKAKARLATTFGRMGFPPPKGSQGFWSPVSGKVLDLVHPYVRRFLTAIASNENPAASQPAPAQRICSPNTHQWSENVDSFGLTICKICGALKSSTIAYKRKVRR